jgi:hypothetical protein
VAVNEPFTKRSMGDDRISKQLYQDVINSAVIARVFVGNHAAQRVAGGCEPRCKFVEFDVSPIGVDNVVVGIYGIKHVPKAISRSIFSHGFNGGVIVEGDEHAPRGHGCKPSEPFKQRLRVGRFNR